jgi:hypothetical protein
MCPAGLHWDQNDGTCWPDTFACPSAGWDVLTYVALAASLGVGILIGKVVLR